MRDHLFTHTHTHTVTDECLCGPTIPPLLSFTGFVSGKKQDWRSKIKKIQLAL